MPPVSGGKKSNWKTGRQEIAVLARVQSGMYMTKYIKSVLWRVAVRLSYIYIYIGRMVHKG